MASMKINNGVINESVAMAAYQWHGINMAWHGEKRRNNGSEKCQRRKISAAWQQRGNNRNGVTA
jgi:hypothetical protein